MIYVQHLLGIGHLRRISFLANGLVKQNLQVDLVSGGHSVSNLALDGVNLHQLPPVRSLDGKFDQLIDEHEQLINEQWKNNRKSQLLTLFDQIAPDVLITETYPFGRRMMRFELIPLLEAAIKAQPKPIVITSIRDILQPKSKLERNLEIDQKLKSYYSKVLVHGDSKVADLSATYPLVNNIKEKIFYTGYITDFKIQDLASKAGKNEIIISGGGGAASLNLLKTAIKAKPVSKLKDLVWRLLVGNNIDQKTFESLVESAPEGLIVERNRADFSTLLKNCTVSVSQAGYNTVMDILQNNTKAVLVPFAENGELEQTIRTQHLAKIDRVQLIKESEMTAKSLAEAISKAANRPLKVSSFNMDGVKQSALLIAKWIDE